MATSQKFDILDGLETSGNVAFDTNVLFVDAVNDRVGVGTSAPATALDVNGTATINNLTLDNLSAQGSEATSLMINSSGVVGTRELGTLAFSSASFDNYSSWTIQDGDTTTYTVTSGDTLQIKGPADGIINANFTADDVLTIDHGAVTREDPATTSASPNYSGTFTHVTGVTTNSDGHVTAVATEEITLPASDNTDVSVSVSAAGTGTFYPMLVNGTGTKQGLIDTTGLYFTAQQDLLYVANTIQSGIRVKTPKLESGTETDTHISFATDTISLTAGGTERFRAYGGGSNETVATAYGKIETEGYREGHSTIAGAAAGQNIDISSNNSAISLNISASASGVYPVDFINVPTSGGYNWTVKITNLGSGVTDIDWDAFSGASGTGSMAIRWAEGVQPPASTGINDIDIYSFYMIDGVVYASLSIRNAG